MEHRTAIAPDLIQDLLESAPNALSKGQAQYFTPLAWARLLAKPLPDFRRTILDPTCGYGALLYGASVETTTHLLGADIDSAWSRQKQNHPIAPTWIKSDLTTLYSLLTEVDFRCALWVCNPPFDLHWSRERLAGLAKSEMISVRKAFAAHDGRTSADTIDSTVATLCIALDRCEDIGEGYCITNASTVERLIFAPNAPHRALQRHIWARLTIAGNICNERKEEGINTAVLYFAASHEDGVQWQNHEPAADKDIVTSCILQLRRDRISLRNGCEARPFMPHSDDASKKWVAVREEVKAKPGSRPAFNLWLDETGHIQTYLSLFLAESVKVDKDHVRDLHSLRGKRPAQLVLLRESRETLMRCCGLAADGTRLPWVATQALIAAVQAAVADYHAARAPLVALPPIQRLGYLDEESSILCTSSLEPNFVAGERYPLSARTVKVTRAGRKWNLSGGQDKVEYTGQELAFFITAGGREWCFMEGRLKTNPDVSLHCVEKAGWQPAKLAKAGDSTLAGEFIDHTLQELADHFLIPEVPDIAAMRPTEYQVNLQRLAILEELLTRPPQ
jgi:predicted RNA methylase